jgi:hypothetical protein
MKALSWVLTGLMGAGALVLWLNLREVDRFELGSLEPVDGSVEAGHDLDRLNLTTFHHGDCEHPLEILEHRRTLTLRDVDGWYRLFWAGSDIYHYKEIVHLAADLQNATAVEPRGRWEIRVRAGPGACGTVPIDRTIVYTLDVAAGVHPAQGGERIGLTEISPILVYSNRAPRLPPLYSYAWILEN